MIFVELRYVSYYNKYARKTWAKVIIISITANRIIIKNTLNQEFEMHPKKLDTKLLGVTSVINNITTKHDKKHRIKYNNILSMLL